ncbi:sugar nucleotide-binding protein, partial [Streptomyces sp. NPDC047966]
MLAQDVLGRLAAQGIGAVGLDRAALDITDPDAVRRALRRHRPEAVVNCAAWSDVDGAEGQEEAAHRVNATGPRHLAEAAGETGAVLLHLSTDYVFAGDASRPY